MFAASFLQGHHKLIFWKRAVNIGSSLLVSAPFGFPDDISPINGIGPHCPTGKGEGTHMNEGCPKKLP